MCVCVCMMCVYMCGEMRREIRKQRQMSEWIRFYLNVNMNQTYKYANKQNPTTNLSALYFQKFLSNK